MQYGKWLWAGVMLILIALYGCKPAQDAPVTAARTMPVQQTPPTHAALAVILATATTSSTPIAMPSTTGSITPTPEHTPTRTQNTSPTPLEPAGCLEPPEDYTRIQLANATLNARTLAMLAHAQSLYPGEIDLLDAITQGSYTDTQAASFGTHSGGGAVDLSVMRTGTYTVLWDEIEPLVRALRTAGFAAWLRDLDALYPGSPIHIHAVAVGDRELSYTAQLQVYGEFGYFAGMDGLPPPTGQPPNPDPHGEPLICAWMKPYLD